MMRPVRLEMEHGAFVIVHRCESCGAEKQVKTKPEDHLEIFYNQKKP